MFIIDDDEIQNLIDTIGWEGIKKKLIKVTYHNFFNGQPFDVSRLIAASWIDEICKWKCTFIII